MKRTDYTLELCPHCNEYVELSPKLNIQRCTNCDRYIVVCSMCKEIHCDDCKLDKSCKTLNEIKYNMELNCNQVNDLLEWFKENNPYVQVRQSKLLKHLFIVLAMDDDKYIEYDFDDYNFYYSPKNFLKENSKPIKDNKAISACLNKFQRAFQLSKPMVLANNIKDITNIKK